jgi:hypothetical protein
LDRTLLGGSVQYGETIRDYSQLPESDAMPRRSKPLDANAGPLQRMALELRQLRDSAPADRPLSVDDVADQEGVTTSRAAIYGALSATRLVSREALTAMVKAWAPKGVKELPRWMLRRRQCEDELAALAAVRITGGQEQRSPAPARQDSSGDGGADTRGQAETLEKLQEELRKLWEQAGRPSIRQLSASARRAGYRASASTMSNLLNGSGAPRDRTLIAYLAAVGADQETAQMIIARGQEFYSEIGQMQGKDNNPGKFANKPKDL